MKRLAIALAMLCVSLPAAAQTVETAEGDWSNVPRMEPRGKAQMGDRLMDAIDKIARKGQCDVPGLSRHQIDLNLPFLVQFGADGSVQRLVMRKMNCPELESVMGGALLGLVKAGEFRSTGENKTGWYRSEITYSLM